MINKNYSDQLSSYSDFKIILADTDLITFNEMAKLNDDFCFINLSSDFAVNFVIEYEKVDYLLISNRMNNLNKLIAKANKKKIKIFILGKDIEYPLNCNFVKDFLIKEISKNETNNINNDFKNNFKNFFISAYRKMHQNIFLKNNETKKEKAITKKRSIKKNIFPISNIPKAANKISETDSIKNNKQNSDMIAEKSVKKSLNNLNKQRIFNNEIIPNNDLNPEIKLKKHIDNGSFRTISLDKANKTECQIRTIKQKVIAVTKAKGGVGSTVISIFLSTLFKELKTLVVDLNFSEGGSDIGYYLDMPKTPNLMVFTEGFDKKSFSGSIINIFGNFDVIQPPPTFIQAKIIDLKDIYNLTDIARKKYDLIIFDLPNEINEFYLGIVDLADLLVMVSDCTTGSIGRLLHLNNKYICNELEKILVINKFNNYNPLKISIESLKNYFNIVNIVTLEDTDILTSKSDFKSFDFNNYESFKELTYMASEIIIK